MGYSRICRKSLYAEKLTVYESEEVQREECEDESLDAVPFWVLVSPNFKVVVINLDVECDRESHREECIADHDKDVHRNE